MGITDFFKSILGCRKESFHQEFSSLTIDLSAYTCGKSKLGSELSRDDFFTKWITQNDCFLDPSSGIEISTKEFCLDSVLIKLDQFPGKFTINAENVELTSKSSENDIISIFGEPYWRDEDDDEILLFYETIDGKFETQFEFGNKQGLTVISILTAPVLADAEQRKLYGVNKEWPPSH